MARKVRIQCPGAIYHVMNRGDHKERIFCDDQDRQQFLATLEEVCQKTAWQVHALPSGCTWEREATQLICFPCRSTPACNHPHQTSLR